VLDDLGWEAMAAIVERGHAASYPIRCRSRPVFVTKPTAALAVVFCPVAFAFARKGGRLCGFSRSYVRPPTQTPRGGDNLGLGEADGR
jgi:hypothetical protein